MKQTGICVAVLANVDAGKTTLAEQILLKTGVIRTAGRVDHGDSFLDTHELERRRGITIFSKMARIPLGGRNLTLLDTPGHVDFSAETERTLQIADCAVLLISAADGVTGHTMTLWSLLERYRLPTLIFVNKMDQQGADAGGVLEKLRKHLDERCICFSPWADAAGADRQAVPAGKSLYGTGESLEDFYDSAAMCDEAAMEEYLEKGMLSDEGLRELFALRKIFPCFFGSALKGEGTGAFLNGLSLLIREKEVPDEFGALCYKISRDEKGNRLSWLKITGGKIRSRALIAGRLNAPDSGADGAGGEEEDPDPAAETGGQEAVSGPAEKINQIRLYSGDRFTQTEEASAGQVAAVTGLTASFCGQIYGSCTDDAVPAIEPVLSYDLVYPPSEDRLVMFGRLRELAEEIPEISPQLDEVSGAIHVRVMGEVQTEILKSLFEERYGTQIGFGDGQIVYRETIADSTEGVGHFEPLRHYAEVHLLLEPGEKGSGIVYASDCPTDLLARNWQRLALSTLRAHRQVGVLTGSELTDVKVTLLSGRSHIKHTVGGDFRQAARRALRQGLMKCRSILLEPCYDFTLDLPAAYVGRALLDIENAAGHVDPPEIEGELAHLTGYAPVSTMRNYQAKVRAYTSGRGWLELTARGYEPCHNPEEVIEKIAYEPERDLRNPTWSVFCAHGSGFEVPWDQVEAYMHLPLRSASGEGGVPAGNGADGVLSPAEEEASRRGAYERYRQSEATAAELDAIFERTYGPVRRRLGEELTGGVSYGESRPGGGRSGPTGLHRPRKKEETEAYLLVDGYNIIFDWDDLRDLAGREMAGARTKLADILSNYQGFRKMNLILVFDAYRVEGGAEHVEKYHNIYIVYTKEAETADRYIERAVHRISKSADITVATSDKAEQIIIWGAGARRMSARELRESIEGTSREIRSDYLTKSGTGRNLLFDGLPAEMAELMEDVRLGRKSLADAVMDRAKAAEAGRGQEERKS